MSDPSSIQPSTPRAPAESQEDDPSETRRTPLLLALVLGLSKLAGVVLVVYLTYYFTTIFAHPTSPPPALTDEQVVLATKAQDLRAQGRKILTSYGWTDPVSRSNLHIPIDRAMELLLAESTRPAVPVAAVPGPVATPGNPGPAAPKSANGTKPPVPNVVVAPPPAPKGFSPEWMYRSVCMACHDSDGRGKIVKLAMPTIPDFTDPKFHASRTDAELTHSILEGKPSTVNGVQVPLMLSMKDKLATTHIDVKDMVAFMRGFKGGKQVVSATPTTPPTTTAATPSTTTPSTTTAATPSTTTPSTTTAATPSTTMPSTTTPSTTTAATPSTTTAATPSTTTAATPSTTTPSTTTAITNVAALPPALSVTSANKAEVAAKLQAASAIFNTTCIACHGPDGKGTLVRAAMPPIPDFTSGDWHASRRSSQLVTSILEGKGTLMPPWNAKVTPEQARNLVLYVRHFGGPDILAKETEGEAAPASGPSLAEFDNKMSQLRQRFDDIEKQLHALSTVR
ncbi:MAG: c-type cytochrome [Isosphaeraceae bacterium]